ncbi:MAG: twitching motility protein PilT [Cognaticolwellia sp.]|jgi:twitching motility protein PilT
MLANLIRSAARAGASDLHFEPGLPVMMRVDGTLRKIAEPIGAQELQDAARGLIPPAEWPRFLERRSADLSKVLGGVSCRINVLQSMRGVGMAVRLLSGAQPTLARLNLHPDLAELVQGKHGLVLVAGSTGSGKSSTLAALIHALDRAPSKHVLTLEEPVEYRLRMQHAFVRQREVGQHTPSFEQGLLDALREDPDVILVGEMRRARTMELTLDAAETGHLVLASMHASSASEAISRLVSSFPSDAQAGVRAQLANCLVGVLTQRLVRRPGLDFRVPECEVLRASSGIRAVIREGNLHKLASLMELGAPDGQWSFARYQRWLDGRSSFLKPKLQDGPAAPIPRPPPLARPSTGSPSGGDGVLDLGDGGGDLEDLIKQIQKR